MNTIDDVIKGCLGIEAGTTIRIKGLMSSDESVKDVTLTLLPADGYREMQKADRVDLLEALQSGDLSASEAEAAEALIGAIDKALTTATDPEQVTRGPAYERAEGSPVYRLPSAPDAAYLLRLRREDVAEHGKPPKGDAPLAKFLLTRKLGLRTSRYVHAVKLQDGRFESLEIV